MELLTALYQKAQQDGITVDCFALPRSESMSLLGADGNCHIAIDPYRLASEEDELIKLAHEVGHCETGAFYNFYAPLDIRQKHERRAWEWAIRELLPREELEKAIRDGYQHPWELAEHLDLPEYFIRAALDYYRPG